MKDLFELSREQRRVIFRLRAAGGCALKSDLGCLRRTAAALARSGFVTLVRAGRDLRLELR